MSAPVLSPAEQAEATRFGIQDAESFAELVEHFDDVVPCVASDCVTSATTSVSMRCCGFQWCTCDTHLAKGRRDAHEFLLSALLRGRAPACTKCGHEFAFGSVFDDIYRVVPL